MPILDNNQTPVSTNSTPALQNWSFSPSAIAVNHYIGEALPAPVTVVSYLKDVVGTAAGSGYTSLNYEGVLVAPEEYSGFVALSGPLNTLGGLQPYTNGLYGDMVYTFSNLNVLAPGQYVYTTRYKIWGTNSGGNVFISEASVVVTLTVFPDTAPQFSPSPITINWVLGTAGPVSVGGLNINAPVWQINSPPGFFFNDPGGVTVVQPTLGGGGQMSGSGAKTFALAMFASVVPEVITQNPLTFYLELNGGIVMVPIIVTFTQPSGMFLETELLQFTAYKGIQEAEPQFVHMLNEGDFTFVLPPWLNASPATANGYVHVGFYPLSSNNMGAGVYEADVLITTLDGSEVLGTIHVIYEVIGAIRSPYPQDGHAYTLDRDFLEFTAETDDRYFELDLIVKAYDFFSPAFKEYLYPYKIALFNKKQVFNIGHTVHRLMAEMTNFLQEGNQPYIPADVSLSVREKSTVDAGYIRNYLINSIRFIAGLRPQLVAGCGFLDVNPNATRVTPGAYYFLNYIMKSFNAIQVRKNGVLVQTYGTSEGVRTIKLNFENLGAAPGDVFEYRIVTASGNLSKFFKVIPPGFESNYIIWENEYKLKGTLECTGDYKLSSEFEDRTQTLFLQLVDVLRKIESTKVCRLTINTGWLLKTDIPSIESLMRAKRAVLVESGRAVNLVPVGKSIINIDNRQELISFDLEFEINRKFNEEIYLF